MKRLILMRHAKSDWSAGLPDIERSLNPRGQTSAKALGDWLRTQGHMPGAVLCSAASRTQETLARLTLPADIPVEVTRLLYLAEAATMAQVLREATADRILMVGHNPGIADFAAALLTEQPDHEQFSRYPTGATLIADFDIKEWNELKMHSGTTVDFVVPREFSGRT
ncbi:phosphoglycerate mutase [Sulfitobacter sp. SK012]|uniref:SixA phosphatase family protein n=1 Tax=Sulfitobacter sp. SK012 TaxID=1389005 RepID=UPI000E09F697|nr:histidine phosphatase family protein [Sulfitobacter sp. SK012]AXI45176.1 phosphoglycerate mutase [Sulfitobacter sp. SK012]